MFEKAARMKLRFPYRGAITAEDLWDLSPRALDSIYRELNSARREVTEDSLLREDDKEDEVLTLQIGIVRHVFEVKKADALAEKNAVERKLKKQKILEIIASKQDEALKGQSVEDLQKLLSELD
jgi:hypothetical protein